jgi:hypothetical protein
MGSIDRKNLRANISCYCPFKVKFSVFAGSGYILYECAPRIMFVEFVNFEYSVGSASVQSCR